MLSIFDSVKSVLKAKRCLIDNLTFRLHYQLTFGLLCFFSLMQTLTQFFGNPIECYNKDLKDQEKVVNTYCWAHGTFTLEYHCNGTQGVHYAHPCVGQEDPKHEGRVRSPYRTREDESLFSSYSD